MTITITGTGMDYPDFMKRSDSIQLTFDAREHRYYFGTLELPGVTRIMDGELTDFSMADPEALERARLLGKNVHDATALDDQGMLDPAPEQDWYPYVLGWRRFVKEMGFVPLSIETFGYHPIYQYAGTYDRVGYLHNDVTGPLTLLDIKRSDTLMPSVGPQTAAYAAIYNTWNSRKIAQRLCVRLFDNDYKHDRLDDQADFSTFLACLTLYNFKRKHRSFYR